MIQIIGLIVAGYAVCRLLQVPLEHSQSQKKESLLWLISLLGILGICVLSLLLLASGVTSFPAKQP